MTQQDLSTLTNKPIVSNEQHAGSMLVHKLKLMFGIVYGVRHDGWFGTFFLGFISFFTNYVLLSSVRCHLSVNLPFVGTFFV